MALFFDPLDLLQNFDPALLDLAADALECERDLSLFLKRSWPAYDASQFAGNWHLDATSDHLMAVADGEIRRLLINLPPRATKTKLCSVAFPAWLWALPKSKRFPLHGASTELLCIAYGSEKAQEDAVSHRRLVGSEWYRERWGDRVQIAKDRDNQERFDTTAGGSRISVGILASVLGRGGNIKILDDTMKPDDPESELVRRKIIQAYDETISSRENDPTIAAEIIIAQRLGELDLPGHVLGKYGSDHDNGGFCHLMIPARYEHERHCVTVLGWQDPRGSYTDTKGDQQTLPPAQRKLNDGTSFWPERFTDAVLNQRATAEGPFSWAAKYQQMPVPRGGGIIKSEWWRLWPSDEYPDFRKVIVSLDTASTEKEENDESGLTAWGIFDGEQGYPQVMLLDAWEGRLEFHQLVTKVGEMCRKRKADILLIEAKVNGHSVAQEIRRLYGLREWSTVLYNPEGDKVARLTSVQAQWSGEYRPEPGTTMGTWSGGVVFAPDKDWAQLTIDRVAAFPKGKNKGIVDTCSQAMKYMRDNSMLLTTEEHQEDLLEERRYQKPRRPMYDV